MEWPFSLGTTLMIILSLGVAVGWIYGANTKDGAWSSEYRAGSSILVRTIAKFFTAGFLGYFFLIPIAMTIAMIGYPFYAPLYYYLREGHAGHLDGFTALGVYHGPDWCVTLNYFVLQNCRSGIVYIDGWTGLQNIVNLVLDFHILILIIIPSSILYAIGHWLKDR